MPRGDWLKPLESPADARWRQRHAHRHRAEITFTDDAWAVVEALLRVDGHAKRSQAVNAALEAYGRDRGMIA